jgi:hypothetical protein
MAINQKSTFGVTENLDFDFVKKDTQYVQGAQQVQDVQQAHVVQKEEHTKLKEYGTTQGNRKGEKLKRINMAFSDLNHEYITKESRRAGMSATAFVNKIIDEKRKI